MRNAVFFFALFSLPMLFSCGSSKNLYYFNDQIPGVQHLDSTSSFATHRIKPNDRLAITISSTDPGLTSYLNPAGTQNGGGYLVNEQGCIDFLLLGKVMVKGLTTDEVATLLKEKLVYYFKDLFISVNLTGKIYMISGNTGSSITINNERLTILEAIAQGGNISPADLRKDVWIIREDSGNRIFAKIDLTSKTIFESPYFYLKNNDFLYIKQNKASAVFANINPVRVLITTSVALLSLIVFLRKL